MKKYVILAILVLIGAGIGLNWIFNKRTTLYMAESRTMQCNMKKYIVFAPGFSPDGRLNAVQPPKINQPVIQPGKANEELADFLYKNRHCFSVILTQRAISDVWLLNNLMSYSQTDNRITEGDYGVLKDSDTRVYQMHRDDPQITVRTFEALCCGLGRLENTQNREIVLVAHDAHYERAFFDLSSMHSPDKIVDPGLRNISYPDSMGPLGWSMREIFVRPVEVRNSWNLPCECQTAVALPPLKSQ